MLDRRQVTVEHAGMALREPREFEIVGGEQRERAIVGDQPRGDRVRQRQAVEGRGAAADLVHQHQRAVGGGIQDGRGLGHLDHEGRAAAGQVVGGADAGEDAVDRAQAADLGRHPAAAVGQQHDQRGLAHVGGLAAHVGAGQHHHPVALVEHAVVGHEMLDRRLHHRMAAAADLDARQAGELGRHPAQGLRAQRERGQHVDLGDRAADGLPCGHRSGQGIEQLLVEFALAGQRALLGRQGLVLEGLQFGRDVALGILQGLAAPVFGGHLVGLAIADLDEEAVNVVEAHAQVGDAGAFALGHFHAGQEGIAAFVDRAQLVQRGIVPGAKHAAIAHQRRGFVGQSRAQVFQRIRGQRQHADHLGKERGLRGQQAADLVHALPGVAQRGQFTRAHVAQRDARRDAFEVDTAGKRRRERLRQAAHQSGDALVAPRGAGLRAQRRLQPGAQAPCASARRAVVQHRQQGGRALAAQGLDHLEVAPRHRIEHQQRFAVMNAQPLQMRGRAALGAADVVDQGPGRADRLRHLGCTEARQVGHLQQFAQLAPRPAVVELPVGRAGHRDVAQRVARQGLGQRARQVPGFGGDDLGRAQPLQFAGQAGQIGLCQPAFAAGQRHPGQADDPPAQMRGHQQALFALGQQRRVGERARRDDAGHLALHRSLARGRVADLLADRHRHAQANQARQVLLDRVHRHAGHRDRHTRRRAAFGQCDAQQPRGALGVLEEQLVKVAHPVEQQQMGMLGLDAQVLLHHWCVFRINHLRVFFVLPIRQS